MRRTSILNLGIFSCFLISGWSQARSQTAAKIVTIDVSGAAGTEAISVNPAGVVIGQYVDSRGAYHGFVRSLDGTITSVDAPGAGTSAGEGTEPWSINPAGEITGWYTDTAGLTHVFLRAPDGTFNSFDAPGAGIPAGVPCNPPIICSNGTQAGAINTAGVIAGDYVDVKDVFHGFLRSADGTVTTFDAPNAAMGAGQGTYLTFGDGISSSGALIGGYADASGNFHGFVRSANGSITSFDPNGSVFTDPAGINAQRVIIGFYSGSSGPYHGFLRSPEGEITSFDVSGAGTAIGQGTEPLNINSPGDIAGAFIDGSGVSHGFLRMKNGAITIFDAPSAGTGSGQGTVPFCNNASNAIVGYYVDSGGGIHGFLLE